MNKKSGITITMLVITIIIMTIIATTVVVTINSSIGYSRYVTWSNEIKYVQEVVDERLNSNYLTNETLGTIYLNVSQGVNEQFESEIVTDSKIELQILDLNKLGIVNTVYGNLDSQDDVYAVSANTGRVYYVAGMEIRGNKYYTLTDYLFDMFGIENTNNELSTVVFKPNKLGYTNEPLIVSVKVPQTFTNVSVTTSNTEISIGTAQLQDGVYVYQVNEDKIAGNYIITVSYTYEGSDYSTEYEVNGYDLVLPEVVIDDSTEGYIIITASDDSGIKNIKYEYGNIAENAKEYFQTNGINTNSGKIKLADDITEYTIYIEDNAGNVAIEHVTAQVSNL